MRASLILLLLFPINVFAQNDVGPLISVLESPAPDARVCTQEDFNSCVNALCGDRTRYQRRREADYEALYDAAAFGSREALNSRMTAILERQRQRNIQFARDLKARIATGTYSVNTEGWDEFQWDNKAHELFANNIEWTVDAAQPLDRKISFTLTGLEERSPAFRSALEAYAREELQNRSTLETYLNNNLLSENELRASITESQRIAGDQVTSALRERLERGENLRNLAWDFFILRPRNKQKYSCRTPECRLGLSRELATPLTPALTVFEENNQSPDFISKHLPVCLSAYIQSTVRLPESEAMIASMPAMRERYIASALAGLSDHSKNEFRKYLAEEVDYSTNLNQNPRTSLDSSFAEAGRPYPPQGEAALLRNVTSQKNYMNPLLGLDACAGPDFLESDSFTPNPVIYEGDSNGNTRVITDPNRKDQISLSGLNCAHPDLGEGVFLHELGHALAYLMRQDRLSTDSKATYINLRSCIGNAGPDLPGNERFPGDKLTTEEDMADFLAAKVSSASPNPASCQLVSELSLMVMRNRETNHAPPMVRLLRDARARGPLPPSCQPIYLQHHSEFRAETCSQ